MSVSLATAAVTAAVDSVSINETTPTSKFSSPYDPPNMAPAVL